MFNNGNNQNDVIQPNNQIEQLEVLDVVTPSNNDGGKNKKDGSKILLIIIAVVITIVVLGLCGYIVYDKVFYTDNEIESKKNKEEENEEEKPKEEGEIDYSEGVQKWLQIYKSAKSEYSLVQDAYHPNDAFRIPAYSDEAELLDLNNDSGYILYRDKGIIAYNIETGKTEMLKVTDKYKFYRMVDSYDHTELLGLYYSDEESSDKSSKDLVGAKFYNLEVNVEINVGKFDRYESVNSKDYIHAIKCTSKCENLLFGYNNGRIFLRTYGPDIKYEIVTNRDGGAVYYVVKDGVLNNNIVSTIYTKDGTIIVDELRNGQYSFENNSLYVNLGNEVNKYAIDGKIVNNFNDMKEVKQLINNFVIVVNKENELVIKDLDSNYQVKLMDWSLDYSYKWEISKYYTKEELAGNKTLQPIEDKNEGIYIVIRTTNENQDPKGVQYYFNTKERILEKYDIDRWPFSVK